MGLVKFSAPLDTRWWDAVAVHLLQFARSHGIEGADLRPLTVLVPRRVDGPCLRAALHRAQPQGGSSWFAPRIDTVAGWAGPDLSDRTSRWVELFDALRSSAWARDVFGDRPGSLWALAAELVQLCDELSLAAAGAEDDFEARWAQSVARHFRQRAAVAADAQSQLVLRLWRAQSDGQTGAAALLRSCARRAVQEAGALAWLAPFELPPWQQRLLERAASHRPVCVVTGDLMLCRARPWLASVWPELVHPDEPAAPLRARSASALREGGPDLRVLQCRSLEEEATAAAIEVERWVREGRTQIALVALDRLTARRVRALLERAGILVADEGGWKLSTTSAAAAVMRWLELVAAGFRIADLLDWLRSPFVLCDEPQRVAAARLIDRLAANTSLARGLGELERALGRIEPGNADAEAARRVVARLPRLAERLKTAATLPRLCEVLDQSLDELGMRPPLQSDPVGRLVLAELAALTRAATRDSTRMTLSAFRELLALHLERAHAPDASVSSPVRMTSLGTACLRPFEAAVLIGADEGHLPSPLEAGTVLGAGVRRDLGLPTLADLRRTQALELTALLGSVPQISATWRVCDADEPRALAPWLERWRRLAACAGWQDPVTSFTMPARSVDARTTPRPAPAAPQRLPDRLSVGACQSLIDCPYQFFARHMLGLRRREPAGDLADKRDFGTALHAILQRLHRDVDAQRLAQMSDDELADRLERLTREQFERDMSARPALVAYRRRVLDLIAPYVAWLRQRLRDGWVTTEVERVFVAPVNGPDSVQITGRIDRIDRRGDGEAEIIDYKARTHPAVKRSAADPGEDIQLPLYALALPAGTRASYLSFERAGDKAQGAAAPVRQFPAAEPFDEWVQRVQGRLAADLQRIAAGETLQALGTAASCARCDVNGLCRRADWEAL